MTRPMVTIGVCVRNGAKLISEAINSILGQNLPHKYIEIIFVDDGSKDKTLSIIDSYLPKIDMQVKVFHHDWRGLGETRNVVVNSAKGKYIVWVDCDMKLSHDHVRKQVEFMEENPNVAIGKGRYGIDDASSLVAFLENIEAVVEFLGNGQKTISKPLGAGGSIYRVHAIREVGGFDDHIKGVGEDMDLETRVRKSGWLLQITPALFYEIRRKDWRSLWKEYLWHGSAGQVLLRKMGRPTNILYKMFPPVAVFTEVARSCAAYRVVYKKAVFLLPLHWIFKRIAWCIGFVMSYLD